MWKLIVGLMALLAVAEWGVIACYTPRDTMRCPVQGWQYSRPCVDDPTQQAFYSNCPCYPTRPSTEAVR